MNRPQRKKKETNLMMIVAFVPGLPPVANDVLGDYLHTLATEELASEAIQKADYEAEMAAERERQEWYEIKLADRAYGRTLLDHCP